MSVEVREATIMRHHEGARESAKKKKKKPLAAMHFIPVAALRKNVHLGNIVPVFLITMQILSRWHRVLRDEQEKTPAPIFAEKKPL